VLATGAFLALAACGIRPLYAPPSEGEDGAAVSSDLASVAVSSIPDRRGQLLRNKLSGLLQSGSGAAEKYLLDISLEETQQSLAIRTTGFATRSSLRINAIYKLLDSTTGQPLVAGSVAATSSYDLLDSDFSTLTAIDDARTRVVDRLATDLRNRLAVYFASRPDVPATP
jgi:Predicted secreted (periplasmic) protein